MVKSCHDKPKEHASSNKFCFRVSAYKTHQKSIYKNEDRKPVIGEEGFPSLCVLSEKKKQEHYDRIKIRSPEGNTISSKFIQEELSIGKKKHSNRFKFEVPR